MCSIVGSFSKQRFKDDCPYVIDIPWDKLIEEN